MNRDIKFRAYDKINKEMVYSDKEDCFYVNTKGVLFMFNNPKKDEYYKSYDVMQYTGLKDKNGVEIYCSDIVIGSAYEKDIYTGVVEFYDASFVMKIDGSKGYYRLNKITFQTLEVIGNIYEHGFLLEKTV